MRAHRIREGPDTRRRYGGRTAMRMRGRPAMWLPASEHSGAPHPPKAGGEECSSQESSEKARPDHSLALDFQSPELLENKLLLL